MAITVLEGLALRVDLRSSEWRLLPICATIQKERWKANSIKLQPLSTVGTMKASAGAAWPWPLLYEASDLRDVERKALECPGAALPANGVICLRASGAASGNRTTALG